MRTDQGSVDRMVDANGKDGGDVARRQNESKASENERSPRSREREEGFVSPNVPGNGFSHNATPQARLKLASVMGYGLGVLVR